MSSITGGLLCRALERHGWKLLRVNGSHHVYGKDNVSFRISVPVHSGKPLKRGMLMHILKLVGLDEGDI